MDRQPPRPEIVRLIPWVRCGTGEAVVGGLEGG